MDGARDATMDTSHRLPPSPPSSRRVPRWMYALRAAGDRWSRSSDGVSGVVTDGARMARVWKTNRHQRIEPGCHLLAFGFWTDLSLGRVMIARTGAQSRFHP